MPIPDSSLKHKSQNVTDLTRENVLTIAKLEQGEQSQRSASHKMADTVAAFCGSTRFLWVHIIWFTVWIAYNVLAPRKFDVFPFTFLTLVVSLEAIFLSTFILISQNNDTRLSERRNHLDLQINLLAEQENTMMLRMLSAIAEKVGAVYKIDPSLEVLEQATEPEKLIEQIEEVEEKISSDVEKGEQKDQA